MENTDLRSINVYEGKKVNHPHNAANNIHAFLTLVFAAFPLLILFIPSIANEPGVNGLDIFKYGFDILTNYSNGGPMPPETNLTLQVLLHLIGTHLTAYAESSIVMIVVLTFIMIIMFALSVPLIIHSLVHFIKGYSNSTVAIPIIAAVDFVLSIVYFIFMLVYHTWIAQVPGTQSLVVWFTIIPMVVALAFIVLFGIFQGTCFAGSILESEVQIVTEPVVEARPVEPKPAAKSVKVEQNAVIPPNTTSIGGHAYAENQKITIANIPLAVNRLGAGAFANCLKLRVVSIPKSVIEIGENCFFNCASLERINYAGTKAEWANIKRGSNWLARAKTTEVVCSDATIVVDPYK